jgi:hypothetical protein
MPKRAPKADPNRTPERLANGFEPMLRDADWGPRRAYRNLVCENKEEADALAAELRRRGWKAKPGRGINLRTGKGFSYVYVTGPSKRRPEAP